MAIIAKANANEIEIIQQNAGPFVKSRAYYPLIFKEVSHSNY